MKKEIRTIVRQSREAGWTTSFTGTGHILLRHPNGGRVILSSTPSDQRSLMNIRSQIRRVEKGRRL